MTRNLKVLSVLVLASLSCAKERAADKSGQDNVTDVEPVTDEPSTPALELPALTHELCQRGAWCWVSPRPHGNELADVVASSGTDIWAVGSWGTVMHFDGASWSSESIGDLGLRRVWPRGPDDVWAIGYEGAVAHRDAEGWTVLASGTDVTLNDIDGVGDDVWILGDKSVVLHWDGHTLARDHSFPRDAELAIEVLAADDIWVGGASLHHFDGQAWTRDPGLGLGACSGLHAFAPDDLWCADQDGRLFHRTEGRWEFALSDGRMAAFTGEQDLPRAFVVEGEGRKDGHFVGLAPDDLYVEIVGEVHHWDGARWQRRWTLPRSGKWIAAMTITPDHELFAVGTRGRMLRGKGEPWTEISRGADSPFNRIVVDADGALFVADTWNSARNIAELVDGVLVEAREGVKMEGGFPKQSDESPRARRIAEEIGWSADAETIKVFDGSAWVVSANPIGDAEVRDVWLAGPRRAWAVASPTHNPRSQSGDAWILEWDGESWRSVEKIEGAQLYAIDGVDPEHIWAGGDQGLLQWDGTRWTKLSDFPKQDRYPYQVVDIVALAPDDVWVADTGAVHHFDGTTWTTDHIGFRVLALAVAGGRVWVGGHGQLIVKTL